MKLNKILIRINKNKTDSETYGQRLSWPRVCSDCHEVGTCRQGVTVCCAYFRVGILRELLPPRGDLTASLETLDPLGSRDRLGRNVEDTSRKFDGSGALWQKDFQIAYTWCHFLPPILPISLFISIGGTASGSSSVTAIAMQCIKT